MSPLPRLRARRRHWVLLVVPALALRALIPVGFMPVAAADGLSIELCPDAGAAPFERAAHDPLAHHHHQHGPGGHAPCLYAASATLASAPAEAAGLAQRAPESHAVEAAPSARTFVPSILRTQSPRAPPLLRD